jgi:hypothetical protein
MKTRSTRTAPAREGPAPWNFLSDLGRQQMSVCTEASSAMIRGFDAMRKLQEQAAHDATERHAAVARKLQGASQPLELMTIQAASMRDDLESATQYWQQLAATTLEMQTEVMGCASHLLDSESALEAASAVEALDMIPGMSSLFPRAARLC